jgi:hypothetical protein
MHQFFTDFTIKGSKFFLKEIRKPKFQYFSDISQIGPKEFIIVIDFLTPFRQLSVYSFLRKLISHIKYKI